MMKFAELGKNRKLRNCPHSFLNQRRSVATALITMRMESLSKSISLALVGQTFNATVHYATASPGLLITGAAGRGNAVGIQRNCAAGGNRAGEPSGQRKRDGQAVGHSDDDIAHGGAGGEVGFLVMVMNWTVR